MPVGVRSKPVGVEIDDFERQSSFFSVNDFFVPAAAVIVALYFLLAGNLVLLLLLVLAALVAFNAWSSHKTRDKHLLLPSFHP